MDSSERGVLHVGKPNILNATGFIQRIERVLERGWLTNDGPELQEFEKRLAKEFCAEHCVAVCNWTVGTEVLLRAMGLVGEVIIPGYTFVATAHVCSWLGLKPVMVDIDRDTHCIDPGAIEGAISRDTCAIMPVHLWGQPCDIASIEKIGRRHGIPVVYDAAHAAFSLAGGRRIGGFGSAEVFSFHATKFLGAFEGGAILTNDAVLAKECRLGRNFGFDGIDSIVGVGTNAKMSEASAAMGNANLDVVGDLLDLNRRNFQWYQQHLPLGNEIRLVGSNRTSESNCQYVVCELDAKFDAMARDAVVAALWDGGVRARKYFWPGLHRVPPYSGTCAGALPAVEFIADRVIVLPSGHQLAETDVVRIASIITSALSRLRLQGGSGRQ